MFAYKNNYFLIIENTKDLDLENIKIQKKFTIIYRNKKDNESVDDIKRFRKFCKLKRISFYIANNINLMVVTNSDGIYLSASNLSFKALNLNKSKFKIIGGAHNVKEIELKKKKGFKMILFSKLFLVDYDKSSPFLGIVRFNKYYNYICNKLVPLGGIKLDNLNSLKNINGQSVAILSLKKAG